MTPDQNIELLNSFKEYKEGWLGRESEPIPIEFINVCLNHIDKFLIQPNITAFDNGICLYWHFGENDSIEINVSDMIDYVVTLGEDIVYDMVIEAKFISQYANRVLKQQLRNA